MLEHFYHCSINIFLILLIAAFCIILRLFEFFRAGASLRWLHHWIHSWLVVHPSVERYIGIK